MSQRDEHGQATADGQPTATSSIGIAFLAVASGSLDVIAFLTLGQVFASAMTGNTALLGIAISRGDWVAASQPGLALTGFAFGAAVASVIVDPRATRRSATLLGLVLFEAIGLVVFAIIWQLNRGVTADMTQYLLILLCSFSMGMQGVAAKMVKAPGVNTIVFTSTVVEIVSSVTNILLGRHSGPRLRSDTLRQIFLFCAYGSGALVAGLLAWSKFAFLAWLPVAAVLLALGCFAAVARQKDA